MAGPPMPAEPDPVEMMRVARGLRDELHVATRYRMFKTIAIGVLAAAFLAFGLTFGLSLADTNAVAHANQEQARREAAAAACQDAYDTRLARVLRARSAAAQRSQAALLTLIGEVAHPISGRQFRADVRAYQRAVQAAEHIPVPPLPPAACK